MVYCINHFCNQRHNPDDVENCLACGTPLLINERIRLLRPLRPLEKDIEGYTDVLEVEDIDPRWGTKPRIRVMKVLKWNEPKYVELVRREVQALINLSHPGIPQAASSDYFTFTLPKEPRLELHCLVMEKMEGENLQQWLETNGKISQNVALEWMLQLLDILDHVHKIGYFHRDIKPTNIIHQPNGNLALVDFGTVRKITRTYLVKVASSGRDSITGGGGTGYEVTAVCSIGFSAPEQMDGRALPQSDFYALGRTIVNLVTGVPMLQLPTEDRTGKLIWRDKAPQIDKPIADLIDEMIHPFPGFRPQTTEIITERIQKLPWESKVYHFLKSKVFKIGRFVAGALIILGIGKLSAPSVANYLVAQGEKSETRNDYQSAENFFSWAIKTNSSTKVAISKYYLDKASRLMLTGNLSAAKKNYDLSIKYNNQNIDAYNLLGINCQQLSDSKCVEDVYKKLLKLNPNDWTVHYNLGRFYDGQGDYKLAEKEYSIAIKSSSSAMIAINNLSRLKIKTGNYNLAISLAQSGLKKNNDPLIQAALYKNLGWASLEQNKISDAEKYLEKALSLDNQRIDAYCLLAKAQETLGKIDDARTSIEFCLLAKSTDSDIPIWRQELLDRILKK
ncbi:Tetratricopeptide (plasmid) [Nostoc flagelliforme CCNUN1]|uniref:non-specific serine/threonine protein kinase n=1 Tax=Nostoc flagelliforme CCNUN1 TaxID=2038116 RepID=A0A2K8T9R3_9NOSO|nr:serine/threonine-protein kinase [Nostoc flagelliforme]AUB44399.1 Tetratricopeptide [Nostoc flagelliforme CCNUN1]